ncbi:phosphate ABC transporter permease subunit PstC [Yinghuangia seranimata]|uniref:phosphate ABC transporter permease subunit PstC n=1 Tax=Yinghuangia seranimata TaxID=408067 RepID=UPI00248C4192|nr:phosphate ABC transporter permease subunit PstC [Yinghuangia seranimata]MDI2132870.1 phosphate ABC transporter permease subunit PstC [Yinghuangia seranimata]
MTAAPLEATADRPRKIVVRRTAADQAYRWTTRVAACTVLALLGAIGVYLLRRGWDAIDSAGWSFLTEDRWQPARGTFGVKGLLVGTTLVAVTALIVAVPIALTGALFITEFAPRRVRRTLTSLVDLMAAVPSIVYGLFGFFLLQPQLIPVSRWLAEHFGFVPVFKVHKLEGSSRYADGQFASSLFIAGVVVACMVIPICCAVMREVFSQAPQGEKEGALALGATRWGVIRSVVLPFGRGGIIGGTMLGLGRALGETIAVAIILSFNTGFTIRVLEGNGSTISTLIILKFGESDPFSLSALMAAGLALFVMTLIVNVVAGLVIARSRNGAATEI